MCWANSDQESRFSFWRLPPRQVIEPRPISRLPIFSSLAKTSSSSDVPALVSSTTFRVARTLCFRSTFLFLGIAPSLFGDLPSGDSLSGRARELTLRLTRRPRGDAQRRARDGATPNERRK